MAQIQRIKTGDTNWGDEATKLNTNFSQLNQNKVEAVPGSRLITEEEAQKLNDLQNLEQPNLNETDPSSFAYVKGQEKIQLIMKAQELQNPPTASTLTYQVNGETFSYKIGQFVRAIVDGEPKIYQLYNMVNGSAVWKETNTGSGGGGDVSGYAEGFSWYELTNPGDIEPQPPYISVVSLDFRSVQGSHRPCVVSILKYPNKTARENSRDDYGDFTPTSQSTWIIKDATESTVMSITISGEECLGINQVASNAFWRIDGVFQSGRTGTVDCDDELHNIQFNGG